MSNAFYNNIQSEIESLGFKIVDKDFERPWGGFLVIDEAHIEKFIEMFFSGIDIKDLMIGEKLSPKILIVKPNARLSWQYHNRRAEIWQIYKGEVAVIRSGDDTEGKLIEFSEGKQIKLSQGERHRLIGLNDYGVVAEIWQHTDPLNPSSEEDIIRVQDDFGR